MTTKHIEIPEADYLAMREEIEKLRKERKCAAEDWCSDDDDIRKHALRVLPESVVNGDSHQVPRFGALAELLANEVEKERATIAKLREAVRLCDAYFSFSKMLSGGYAESSINRLGIANEMKWKAEQAIAEVEQ